VHVRAGKNYEEEFASEIEKGKTGQVKNTPWGSSYAKTPKILHGKSCSLFCFNNPAPRCRSRIGVCEAAEI